MFGRKVDMVYKWQYRLWIRNLYTMKHTWDIKDWEIQLTKLTDLMSNAPNDPSGIWNY